MAEEKIKLPSELRIKKKQNPQCNEKGRLCGLFCHQEACLKIILDKQGNFQGFELLVCKQNPKKKLEVEI